MNMDTGAIKLWSQLTEQERGSGRWVALTEGEHAEAITIEEHERRQRLNDIFRSVPKEPQQGRFDAMGRPEFDRNAIMRELSSTR